MGLLQLNTIGRMGPALAVVGMNHWVRSIAPTYVSEVLTDPSLEATYTAGKCNTLSKNGAPTLAQSADVHTGAKAQEFTGTANNDFLYLNATGLANAWYRYSAYAKRTAGAAGTAKVKLNYSLPIVSAAYTRLLQTARTTSTTISCYAVQQAAATPFDTVIVDDMSLQQIILASAIKSRRDTPNGDVYGAVTLTIPVGVQGGMMFCVDDPASPLNFILLYYDASTITLVKCVAGTYAAASISTAASYTAGGLLEFRKNGSLCSVWYKGVRIGATQTISDADIVNNTKHYQFATDPSVAFGSYLILPDGIDPNFATSTNAVSALTTPTYDTSGQAVHPGVYDAGSGSTWNSKRYWMAMTPYPAGDDSLENPSILCSDDNATWTVPVGLTNPIEAAPGSGHNADPFLILGQDNKLYCFFMFGDTGVSKVYVKSSSDGVTWSAKAELLSGAATALASPSVIWDGSQYVMYYIDASASPYHLYKRTCATPDGTWSTAISCGMTAPTGKDIWHLCMVYDSGQYFAFVVVCTAGTTGTATLIYFATSKDGQSFVMSKNYLLTHGAAAAWDETAVYQGSAIKSATGFEFWYSAYNSAAAWHIGYTTVTYGF